LKGKTATLLNKFGVYVITSGVKNDTKVCGPKNQNIDFYLFWWFKKM
jgi:hypothetical protein